MHSLQAITLNYCKLSSTVARSCGYKDTQEAAASTRGSEHHRPPRKPDLASTDALVAELAAAIKMRLKGLLANNTMYKERARGTLPVLVSTGQAHHHFDLFGDPFNLRTIEITGQRTKLISIVDSTADARLAMKASGTTSVASSSGPGLDSQHSRSRDETMTQEAVVTMDNPKQKLGLLP
jgi:hypothetical protein